MGGEVGLAGVWNASGYNLDLTLNLYQPSGPDPEPGALLASVTSNFLIPWRPEPSPGCAGNPTANNVGQWFGSDNACHDGLAFTVAFSQGRGVIVPDQIICGMAVNTSADGVAPFGVSGPYNQLNLGFISAAPSLGTNPVAGSAYLYSTIPAAYCDGGTAGDHVFRQNAGGWGSFIGSASFDAIQAAPEPASAGLILAGVSAMAFLGVLKRLARATAGPIQNPPSTGR